MTQTIERTERQQLEQRYAELLYELEQRAAGHDVSGEPRDAGGKWTVSGTALERGADKRYRDSSGKTVSAADHSRLAALKVPPAWKNVRLNPDKRADLQVVGTDAKGRSQYLYSAQHSERSAAEKFDRLRDLTKALPSIREQVTADLKNPTASPTTRDAAAVIRLIDKTGFRPGSETDTGGKVTAYGATTLRAEHVTVDGNVTTFKFTAKHGVEQNKTVDDREIAGLIRSRLRTAKQRDGKLFDVSDGQVRDYLHGIDDRFKPKDLRTYNGTTTAIRAVKEMPVPTTKTEYAKAVRAVATRVAQHLGNTPAVALSSYISPNVFSKWKRAVAAA